MTPPRVVLDTNVFIAAAFRPDSDSGRVLAAARSGRLHLVWDDATRAETRRLLEQIPPVDWEAVEDLFRPESRWRVPVDRSRFGAVEDPEDRKFAALAAASDTVLLSLDRHLLDAPLDGLCTVLTPSQFLAHQSPR